MSAEVWAEPEEGKAVQPALGLGTRAASLTRVTDGGCFRGKKMLENLY